MINFSWKSRSTFVNVDSTWEICICPRVAVLGIHFGLYWTRQTLMEVKKGKWATKYSSYFYTSSSFVIISRAILLIILVLLDPQESLLDFTILLHNHDQVIVTHVVQHLNLVWLLMMVCFLSLLFGQSHISPNLLVSN